MKPFRDLAFKHKLTAVLTAVSAISLLFSSAILLSRETLKLRSHTQQDLHAIAEILAANSVAALEFRDERAAHENLAGLELKPQVRAARLFAADGRILATFVRKAGAAGPLPEQAGPDGFRAHGSRISMFRTVVLDGERVGTLFIQADAEDAWSEMRSYVFTILFACVVSAGAALALSRGLQGAISTPIEQLTAAVGAVAESGDYSVRVASPGGDELGVLTAAFNRMLGRIQEQDAALRAARDGLELKVEERVRELRKEIVERRAAETALQVSQRKYKAIVENTNEWIWSVDVLGRWTYNNGAIERILGYSPEELLGRDCMELLHADDRAPAAELLSSEDALLNGWSGALFRWRHKNGSYRTLESVGAALKDGAGNVVGFHGIDHDITARLRLEEQLRQSQKMDAIGRLAGGIAHDFNNLLGVILGYSDLLMKRGLPEGAGTRVEQIRRAAERAAGLTRQLLAFSRKQVLDPKVLDLNTVISDLGRMLPRLIGEDVEVALAPKPNLWRVKADPTQIDQVLMNLAVNARDAMPQGGRLSISTANVDADEALARSRPPLVPGRYVMLSVADNGCGMDAATRARIFEPFFTTKEKGKGTGLGLATVYGIVEQSGGHIWVASEPGRGTTFEIYLPRLEGDASRETQEIAPSEQRAKRATVLVVEDEEALRGLTRELLESNGFAVLTAGSGAEALDLSRSHQGPIDLLLTDVVMPGFSGKVLADLLVRERPSLPVVFMSGYTDDAIARHQVLEEGTILLQKPFDEKTLISRLQQVLRSVEALVHS
jgi:PAS domain S-box-containing protein